MSKNYVITINQERQRYIQANNHDSMSKYRYIFSFPLASANQIAALLYNITVQYKSKSYIVRYSAHDQVRAVKGVITLVVVRSDGVENIRRSDPRAP